MSSVSSNRILSIYKSRNTMLQLLESQDYDISDYNGFNINEVDAMFVNSQLDMLLTKKTNGQKIYVKYYFSAKLSTRQIRPQNLNDIIEDLYEIDCVLEKKDTLCIIIDDEPNETILAKLRYLFNHDGIFVIIHNIKRLQFNILEHKLVPSVKILNPDEVVKIKDDFNIKNIELLPEISRFDPLALAICMRPGQVCHIIRNSATALNANFYRICI